MNILFVYRSKRTKIEKDSKKKIEPNHFLYGYGFIKKTKIAVSFSDAAYRFPILHWIFFPFEQMIIKKTSIGFKLDQAILLIPKALNSDVLVTTTDSAGLPFLLLKKARVLKKPIIYISTGLVNEMIKRQSSVLIHLYKNLLKESSFIICHSPVEREQFIKMVPALKNKIIFIPFCIDINFFKKSHNNGGYILSIGRDRSRDYKLLFAVAEKARHEEFVLITEKSNIKGLIIPKNIKVYFNLTYKQVRDYYQRAKTVFIPLRELHRSEGQVSFLESIATRNKTIIAGVEGITESYPRLINRKNIFLYRPGKVNDAYKKLVEALKSQEKRTEPLNMNFDSKKYAMKIISLVKLAYEKSI